MLESPELYPELATLQRIWIPLRDEVKDHLYVARDMTDERAAQGAWKVMPFLPRGEDRRHFSNEIIDLARKKAPQLCRVIDEVPKLHAYYLSIVNPNSALRMHTHVTPLAVATLCLAGGVGAYMQIGRERHALHDGKLLIYDQRRMHGVVNDGPLPRVALIVAMELRR